MKIEALNLTGNSTPAQAGSYSFVGSGLAVCSPCCANTFYQQPAPVKQRSPLTTEEMACPVCHGKFAIVNGEIEIELEEVEATEEKAEKD